ILSFLLLLIPRPPTFTLFPYTTLFRSDALKRHHHDLLAVERGGRRLHPARPAEGELQSVAVQLVNALDQLGPFAHRHHLNLPGRSEEHTSELQSLAYLVCRLLLEKKKQ